MAASSWIPLATSDDREHWLAKRKLGLGASDIASVLHLSPWRSALELWAQKTERVPEDDLEGIEAVWWGHQLEAAIIGGYAKRTERAAVPFGVLLQSARWPWLLATPDALTTDDPRAAREAEVLLGSVLRLADTLREDSSASPEHIDDLVRQVAEYGDGWWPLQVKNSGDRSAAAWADGPPPYYAVQARQESLVWGGPPKATVCALLGGQQLAWADIDVDDFERRRIVKVGRRFWEHHVGEDVAPDPDETDGARRTLNQITVGFDDDALLLPSSVEVDLATAEGLGLTQWEGTEDDNPFRARIDIDQIDQAWIEAREQEREGKRRSKLASNLVMSLLGQATTGVLPDGTQWRSTPVVRGRTTTRRITRKEPQE